MAHGTKFARASTRTASHEHNDLHYTRNSEHHNAASDACRCPRVLGSCSEGAAHGRKHEAARLEQGVLHGSWQEAAGSHWPARLTPWSEWQTEARSGLRWNACVAGEMQLSAAVTEFLARELKSHDPDVRLGQGAFGTVFAGVRKQRAAPGQEEAAAVKVSRAERTAQVQREHNCIQSLMERPHENVIQVWAYFYDASSQSTAIVMEAGLGSLLHVQRQFSSVLRAMARATRMATSAPHTRGYTLPTCLAAWFSHDCAAGLAHCHSLKIMHRDLKPGNVICTAWDGKGLGGASLPGGGGAPGWPRTLVAKLADFGSARNAARRLEDNGPMTMGMVTPGYQAPEAFDSQSPSASLPEYSYPMDVWSLGCLLGELCFSKVLFEGETDRDESIMAAMVARLGPPPSDMQLMLCGGRAIWQKLPNALPGMRQLKELPCGHLPLLRPVVTQCLQWDPDARPTAASCCYDVGRVFSAMQPPLAQVRAEKASELKGAARARPHKEAPVAAQPALASAAQPSAMPSQPVESKSVAQEPACQARRGRQSPQQVGRQTPLPEANPAPPQGAKTTNLPPQPRGCGCNGLCDQEHKYKNSEPCPNVGMVIVDASRRGTCEYLCQGCKCEVAGCNKQKTYYRPWCMSHAYLGLEPEFLLVRALATAGVLEVSLPCDLEVLLEPAVAAQLSRHWMIELIAGWIKEPTAVRLWAEVCGSNRSKQVSGPILANAVHSMPATQGTAR